MYETEVGAQSLKDDDLSWITSDLYNSKIKKHHCTDSKPLYHYEDKKMQIWELENRRQSEPIISKISNLTISSPKLNNHKKCSFDMEKSVESEKMPYPYTEMMTKSQLFPSSAENSPVLRKRLKNTFEKCFLVKLYIERRDSHLGPFPFEILPKMNVRLLKLKVEKEFGFPTSSQKWILNNSLAIDNDLSLLNYGIVPGSPILLYIDSSYEKIINVNQSYSCRPESYPKNESKLIHNSISHCDTKILDHSAIRKVAPVNNHDILNKESLKKESLKKESLVSTINCAEAEERQKEISEFHIKNNTCLSIPDFVKTSSEGKFLNKATKKSKLFRRKSSNTKGPFEPVFAKIKEKETNLHNDKFFDKEENSSGINVISRASKDSINSQILSTNSKIQNIALKEMSKSPIQAEKLGNNLAMTNYCNSSKSLSNSNKKISEFEKHGDLGTDNVHVASCSYVEKTSSLKLKPNRGSILQKVRLNHKSKSFEESYHAMSSNKNIQNEIVEVKSTKENILSINTTEGSQIDILPHNVDSFQEIVTKPDEHDNSHQVENENVPNYIIIKELNFNETQRISEKSNILEDTVHDLQTQNTINCDTNISDEFQPTEVSNENITSKHSLENETKSPRSVENGNEISNCDHSEQNLPEENEQLNKESVENYEYLLKIEDLNLVKNVMSFTCPICFGDFESDQGVVLHECLHTFCVDCLARTVDYAEEVLIKCPYRDDEYSCQSYLQQREIKALVCPEIYERYLQKSIITAESIAEKSFHCKTPDCPGWCLFEDNINIFHCPVCLHYNCLNCRTTHEGLNCRQYQDKLKSEKKLDPDSEKTLELLNKMIENGKALRCPKCDLILMKKWGCDWLKCAVCLTEICWITKGPRWGPAGQGDTSGGCRCGVNGIKCHPSSEVVLPLLNFATVDSSLYCLRQGSALGSRQYGSNSCSRS
ncbi:ranBP-type and C3HC4-type zinc finger-containing protein 1 [Nephila pilipes]|uniref:RanBP-type and C3HC4-type zinc finger-containing protein 1 n=1 Tax=Nephila pilipes TaxID=299642 RepID=A0A8X6QDM4_NEPPI|nr:ranBP-type and C3HC4-type zinc finger-containing protein 1 [Nephila pilipes]